jgi:hypothetical protein
MSDLFEELRTVNPEPLSGTEPPPEMRQRVLDQTALRPRAGARRVLRRRVGLSVALGLLVAAGGAGAAVVALSGDQSKPATGPIPEAPSGQPDRYQIAMIPDLRLGANGWCTTVTTSAKAERATLGTYCAPAQKAGTLLVDGGVTLLSSNRALVFYVVDQRVAAARLHNNHIVRATADAAVPTGTRLIAAIVPARAYRFDEGYLRVELLGMDNHPLTKVASDLRDLPTPAPVTAPSVAAGAAAACDLSASGDKLVVQHVSVVARNVVQRATGAAYVTCAVATAQADGESLHVAVLAAPANRAAPSGLPTATAPASAHGANVQQSSRRINRGWLVVQGGTLTQRRDVLAQIVAQVRP